MMNKIKHLKELTKMGDVEQVMAEPEEGDVVEENVDGLHPPSLVQQTPGLLTQGLTAVTTLVSSNGWYALGFAVLAYVIWVKIEPKVTSWRKKRDNEQAAAAYHKDPDKFLARERAIDEARKRMQDQYNQTAIQWAEQQKEQEEKKRQERVEEWERRERGGGYVNKPSLNATASTTVPAATTNSTSTSKTKKDSGKANLRPEYNPMTGDVAGESTRWRPDRRGGASGGG